jgi:hypothetical protein
VDKAIACRTAGKILQAKAAVHKEQHWLFEILVLQAHAARGKRARECAAKDQTAADGAAGAAGARDHRGSKAGVHRQDV